MNESIGEDSREHERVARKGYLEDEVMNHTGYSYEYDYEAEMNNQPDQFDKQKVVAVQNSINRSKRRSKSIETAEAGHGEDSMMEGETDIPLVFFCLFDIKPLTFLAYVSCAKISDVLVCYLLYESKGLVIQLLFSIAFLYTYFRVWKKNIGSKFFKFMFFAMVAQNVFFVGVFIAKLFDFAQKVNTSLVYLRVVFFLFWMIQNIAWDFQVIDSTENFLTAINGTKEKPKSLEKSIEESFSKEPPAQPTKAKLKKRVSSSAQTNDTE